MTTPVDLDMVLVGGEYRVVGVVSPEELEELERMHDDGDIRAEVRLKLLREGRPGDRAMVRVDPRPSPPPWPRPRTRLLPGA